MFLCGHPIYKFVWSHAMDETLIRAGGETVIIVAQIGARANSEVKDSTNSLKSKRVTDQTLYALESINASISCNIYIK